MAFKLIDLYSWDYLIVDCGYIDRLLPKKDDISKKLGNEDGEDAVMFFADTERNNATGKYYLSCNSFQEDPDGVFESFQELVNTDKLPYAEGICFKQGDWDENPLRLLVSYHHCGCFGTEPYQVGTFTTKNGKTVLYKKFDTESG